MSDIEDIREQKREELRQRVAEEPEADGGATAPDEPVHVEGESHLRELVGEHDVVLVDFYADWCGPCQMLAPTLAEVAADTDAAVAKVDIDAHQGLAAEYNVQGVPTVLLFSGGEPAERVVGVRGKDEYVGLVEAH
ncbi:MAG: thioredoxin [Halobacteriaceae archaeon]